MTIPAQGMVQDRASPGGDDHAGQPEEEDEPQRDHAPDQEIPQRSSQPGAFLEARLLVAEVEREVGRQHREPAGVDRRDDPRPEGEGEQRTQAREPLDGQFFKPAHRAFSTSALKVSGSETVASR
jgi:hypothetical protein